jgi:hypothetical protein
MEVHSAFRGMSVSVVMYLSEQEIEKNISFAKICVTLKVMGQSRFEKK